MMQFAAVAVAVAAAAAATEEKITLGRRKRDSRAADGNSAARQMQVQVLDREYGGRGSLSSTFPGQRW
jgi:hypothetical protein